jgi:hypothetical protein
MTEKTEHPILMEKDLLQHLHHREGYFIKDLAESWDEPYNIIWSKLRRYKIDIKLQPTHHFSIFNTIDKDKFDKLYYFDDLSGDEIANILGFDKKTVYKWMQLNNRPTKGWIYHNFPPPKEKECFVCKKILSLKSFSKLSTAYDKHMSRCKNCDHKIGKEYYMKNIDKVKLYEKEYSSKMENKAKKRFGSYKLTHKKKFNEDIPITLDDVKNIVQRPCFYCGSIDNPCNGIDRLNNSIGYEKDNIVPCCRKCNTMKMDLTIEEFKNHIEKIHNKLNGV